MSAKLLELEDLVSSFRLWFCCHIGSC